MRLLGESQSVEILTLELVEEDIESFTVMLQAKSNIRRLNLHISSTYDYRIESKSAAAQRNNAAAGKILNTLNASTVSCVDLRFCGFEELPLSELHALLSSCKWIDALQFYNCRLSYTDVDKLADGIKLNRSLRYLLFDGVTYEDEDVSFNGYCFHIFLERWKAVFDAVDLHPKLIYIDSHDFLLPIASALVLEGMTYPDLTCRGAHSRLQFISQDYLRRYFRGKDLSRSSAVDSDTEDDDE